MPRNTSGNRNHLGMCVWPVKTKLMLVKLIILSQHDTHIFWVKVNGKILAKFMKCRKVTVLIFKCWNKLTFCLLNMTLGEAVSFFSDHGSQNIDVFFKTWVSFFPVGDIFVFQLLWWRNGHAIHPALKNPEESFDKSGWTFFPSSSLTLYIISWKAIGWKFLATPQKDGREHHHFTKKNPPFLLGLWFFWGDTSPHPARVNPLRVLWWGDLKIPFRRSFRTAKKNKASFSTLDFFLGVAHVFTYSM